MTQMKVRKWQELGKETSLQTEHWFSKQRNLKSGNEPLVFYFFQPCSCIWEICNLDNLIILISITELLRKTCFIAHFLSWVTGPCSHIWGYWENDCHQFYAIIDNVNCQPPCPSINKSCVLFPSMKRNWWCWVTLGNRRDLKSKSALKKSGEEQMKG